MDCGKLLSLGINKPGKQTVHGLKCHLEKCHVNTVHEEIPVNKDHLQKKRNWTRYWRRFVGLTWWLNVWKGKKYYQVTFVFIFRTKMNVHFRFRFVFGRKWNFIFVDIFVYDRKWKMFFGRPLVYITKRSWSWSWHAIVVCRFLLGFGRLISYHRNIFAGRTSIIARPGVAGEAAE